MFPENKDFRQRSTIIYRDSAFRNMVKIADINMLADEQFTSF